MGGAGGEIRNMAKISFLKEKKHPTAFQKILDYTCQRCKNVNRSLMCEITSDVGHS